MYCDWPVLGRCCFCLPLRKGVLVFAYVNILFAGFLMGVYSYFVQHRRDNQSSITLMYHGVTSDLPVELCVFIYCVEIVFHAILIYGAHTKSALYIKIFYYFSITTFLVTVLLQILDFMSYAYFFQMIEMIAISFTGFCLQLYLLMLVGSLLKKMETGGPHAYENQLQQIVSGEAKVELNGVYNNSTVIPNDV